MKTLSPNSETPGTALATGAQPWRWSRSQYDRMIKVGILTKADRVELLDGEILTMTPIAPEHNTATMRLLRWCREQLPREFELSIQMPLALSAASQPEPDLMILRPRPHRYARILPTPPDVLLLVEVSLSSRDRDFHSKLTAYAAAGIREYWIVDVEHERLIVHTQPSAAGYSDVKTHSPGAIVAPVELPMCRLEVGWLLV